MSLSGQKREEGKGCHPCLAYQTFTKSFWSSVLLRKVLRLYEQLELSTKMPSSCPYFDNHYTQLLVSNKLTECMSEMKFLQQVEWLRDQIKDIPIRLVFESALELMGTTEIGSFKVCLTFLKCCDVFYKPCPPGRMSFRNVLAFITRRNAFQILLNSFLQKPEKIPAYT